MSDFTINITPPPQINLDSEQQGQTLIVAGEGLASHGSSHESGGSDPIRHDSLSGIHGGNWHLSSGEYSSLMYLTGDQTVSGVKTFSDLLNASGIKFQILSGAPSHQEGLVFYDEENKTISFFVDNPDVTMNLGQELWVLGHNDSSSQINNGSVVYVSGSHGSSPINYRPKIWQAIGNNEISSAETIGVATHDIAVGENGYITTFGIVNNLNTSSFEAGDILYLSPTISGAFTNIKPTAPDHSVKIGYVLSKHNNQGKILVSVNNGYEISELHDVKIDTPQSGQSLIYDSSSGLWRNSSVAVLASGAALANINDGATIDFTKDVSLSGNLTVDATTLFVDSVNNRVGVGTTSPNEKLTIVGNVSVSGNIAAPQIGYSISSGGNITFGTQSVSLKTGTGYVITFDNNGLYSTIPISLGRSSFPWSTIYCSGISSSGTVTATNLVYNTGDQTIAGSKTFSDNIVGNGTANRLPNQTANTSDSIMTRALGDLAAIDPSLVIFRDDFFGVQDASTNFGEMGWTYTNLNGAASVRPNEAALQTFGVVGLHTAAAFRGATVASSDVSNIVGGGGFIFYSFRNTNFNWKSRFRIASLSGSILLGFCGFAGATFRANRFFGLRYASVSSPWTASTAITLNSYRRPTVANGRRYYASVGGTTGGTEPTWPTTAGGTVVDGSVTWTESGYDGTGKFQLQLAPNSADDTLGTFVDTGITVAANTWYTLEVTMPSERTFNFYIDNVYVGQLVMDTTTEGSSMVPTMRCETSAASDFVLAVDYFNFMARGVTRY